MNKFLKLYTCILHHIKRRNCYISRKIKKCKKINKCVNINVYISEYIYIIFHLKVFEFVNFKLLNLD